ncbi:hypothetical protein FQN05_09235 [Corynebacterium aurimucosum]|uniref:Antitoxin VbhA domain-containing protein n=1 Tax=Corynebacterium aurimucosum TaxID=169292 RepID=A0A558IM72_9CORY|nr:hypothetical protein [Corynebacterium aurimucosum]TVU82503.1 hypothetical protein FQN05_09235 [Corynebacterium aurimucosum]
MLNSNQVQNEDPERDPLALSDAALRLAGHDVTDEHVRQLGREVAAGALSADEAIARVRRASLK